MICITHLPQVASLANGHFRISKALRKGDALASVERVDGEELVAEICRMLGAERGDETASRHAQELLAAAPERDTKCRRGMSGGKPPPERIAARRSAAR